MLNFPFQLQGIPLVLGMAAVGLAWALTPFPLAAQPAAVAQPSAARPQGVTQPARPETPGRPQGPLLLTGEIAASSGQTLVVPRVPGWNVTLRWIASNGTVVSQGDKVAEVDDSAFSQELSTKRSVLAEARDALERQRNDNALTLLDHRFVVEQAEIALEIAKLRASVDQDAYALRVYQERQLELATRRMDLAQARDALQAQSQAGELSLRVLEIDLERKQREVTVAERAIEQLSLSAPRDGIVVSGMHPWFRRKIQSGDNVWVNLPLMQLPDLSTLEVHAWLSDVDDGRLQPGDRMLAVLDAFPDVELQGTVASISPVATPRAPNSPRRAFEVRVQLDKMDSKHMLPGMSVRLEPLRPPTASRGEP